MRLNKKRLAALAMSAVMAASAVPFPVYAEELSAGEDVVVSAETTVETPEVGAGTVITWVYDETVTPVWYWNNDKDFGVTYGEKNADNPSEKREVKLTQADGVKAVVKDAANCGHGTKVEMIATLGSKGEVKVEYNNDVTVGEHQYKLETVTEVEPTCNAAGKGYTHLVCEVCNTEKPGSKVENVVIAPTEKHTFDTQVKVAKSENVKTKVENGLTVLDLDKEGKVQLIDVTKEGTYTLAKHCTTCNTWVEEKEVTVPGVTVATARVQDGTVEGIVQTAAQLTALSEGKEASTFKIDENKIELKDCKTAGSYVIEYLDANGNVKDTQKVTVQPHHYNVKKVAVFKTKNDKDNADVTYDAKTKEFKVTSKSCYLPIEYTEVSYCSATNCSLEDMTVKYALTADASGNNKAVTSIINVIDKKDNVAEPTGNHTYDINAYNAIKGKIDNKGYADIEKVEEIIAAATYKDQVKLVLPADFCTKGGDVVVNFICTMDKETVTKTLEFKALAPGHKEPANGVVENKKDATCEHAGSYDSVKRCARCEEELSRVTKVLPRLKHTNEESVATNGVGTDDYLTDKDAELKFVGDVVVKPNNKEYKAGVVIDTKYNNQSFAGYSTDKVNLGVYSEVFTNCQKCGNHEVRLANYLQRDNVKVTIKEVQNDKNGSAGYIVLEAVYTKTNAGADNGKTVTLTSAKIPYYSSIEAYNGRVEPESKNGLYKDEDGKYRYYVDGVLQKDFTGILDYAGNKFLIVSGELANDVNGLWYSEADKTWYFLVEGGVRTDYTGTVLYDGEWFYVSNGRLNEAVNGLVAYNGGTFLFIEGRLRTDVSGLWQDINNPDDWYFLALGQVQTQYKGVAMYDGGFFVVENGKFDKDYNGTIKYNGKTFKVVGGQLVIK